MSDDPLLRPYEVEQPTVRNSAHELACSEDGMPKDRYRCDQVGRAMGGIGIGMTMTMTPTMTVAAILPVGGSRDVG